MRVPLEAVRPGMRVAKAVYTSEGRILLNKGAVVKPRYIRHLRNFGITALYIENSLLSDVPFSDVVDEVTRAETVKAVRNFFLDVQNSHGGRAVVSTQGLRKAVNNIIDELLDQRQLMINLQDIRSMDGYTFAHSVNVCILALITGIALGLKRPQLYQLGLGALMHDIGKIFIPLGILNKKGKLTQEEMAVIREHPGKGFAVLRRQEEVSLVSALVALEHHEKYNGSGYPHSLQGNEIHLFSRIVGVVDVYDALTADRVYRKAYQPNEAYEYLAASGGGDFDFQVVNAFLRHVAAYPVGTWVKMSSGEIGVVVGNRPGFSTRPSVRIVFDREGKALPVPSQLELVRETTLMIERVVPLAEIEELTRSKRTSVHSLQI
ncbi:MAG: HD-GYP domain-containing protein [Bacillota bacterium]|jgi:HD-GYP domain-containing protein (c-di-GMP phosphodiesterase class II)